jgi:hypothetical protein
MPPKRHGRSILLIGTRRVLAALVVTAVLVSACGHSPSAGSGGSGSGTGSGTDASVLATIYGHVRAGPTCPVEQAGHPCPAKPVSDALVEALTVSDGHVAASTRTNGTGSYSLRVHPSGLLRIVVTTTRSLPRCTPRTIRARPRDRIRADVSCDTGIR